MSRSYKKNGWVKDPANRYMKKVASRKLRRKIHQLLSNKNFNDESSPLPVMDELINPYDVCDYILRTNNLRK